MGGNFSSRRGVKRPHENGEETSPAPDLAGEKNEGEIELHTPKRKRIQSTSKYIVTTLFEEGVDSDVTIHALDKDWHLHKLYLCQCRYFDSMFNGCWLESDQSTITIEIGDENIDQEALKIAFKSLYTDNVFVKPVQAVGVLAAATLLQLDPLIEHCKTVMKGCISWMTVCPFYLASERYGLVQLKELCMGWLLHSLMAPDNAPVLADIPEELLGEVLESRELWLLQVEVDVYTLLKKWVFTQINPDWTGTGEELHKDANDYFKRQLEGSSNCFLESEDGRPFIHIFEKVRWIYVINDLSSLQLLKDDRIIPIGWLDPFFKFCWFHHLRTEQGIDTGPDGVSEEDFYAKAMRCGRVLLQEQEYHWRWLGYQYGLDLLFTLRNRVLTVKRNSGGQQTFEGSLSQQRGRQIMVCVRLAQMRKREVCTTLPILCTGIRTLVLTTDDAEESLLTLSVGVKFPLQVTMHLLYMSHLASLPLPQLQVPPPPVDVVPSLSCTQLHTGHCLCRQEASKHRLASDRNASQASLVLDESDAKDGAQALSGACDRPCSVDSESGGTGCASRASLHNIAAVERSRSGGPPSAAASLEEASSHMGLSDSRNPANSGENRAAAITTGSSSLTLAPSSSLCVQLQSDDAPTPPPGNAQASMTVASLPSHSSMSPAHDREAPSGAGSSPTAPASSVPLQAQVPVAASH